jgi:8-oxo-dGTP diphosphatase
MSEKQPRKYMYDYPRAAVTVDIVLVTRERERKVLLIRRKHAPFAGSWAIPGGFIEMDETLEASARRELHEETGLQVGELKQLHTFGDPGRDPRGRTITIVYLARVRAQRLQPRADDDASEVSWFPLAKLPRLAFDHARILACVRRRLQRKA